MVDICVRASAVSVRMNDEAPTLLDFIQHKEEEVVINLLSDPDTCRTFVRLLSPLAQHLLFRLVMLPGPWRLDDFRKWAANDRKVQQCHQAAFIQLRDCHILKIEAGHHTQVQIREEIREMLLYGHKTAPKREKSAERVYPFHSVAPGTFSTQRAKTELTDTAYVPYVSEEILDYWAQSQLEKILMWMLDLTDDIDRDIKQLLADSKLISSFEGNLTRDGHQFVLADPKGQIWRIVRSYLECFTSDTDNDMISALRFLLKLGSLQFTRGYPISELSSAQRQLLKPFCSLGLLCYETPDIPSGYFFPTRVVLNFFGKADIFHTDGWILIDTNFKITAYTSSPLHVALLRKFTTITYQMPGFTSAYISPKSFKNAIEAGTSVADILNFLKMNLSKLGDGTIPPNVEQQFYIWERQRNGRITTTSDCLLWTFTDEAEALYMKEVAEELGGFIAYFPKKESRDLIITEQIGEEFKKRKAAYRTATLSSRYGYD